MTGRAKKRKRKKIERKKSREEARVRLENDLLLLTALKAFSAKIDSPVPLAAVPTRTLDPELSP